MNNPLSGHVVGFIGLGLMGRPMSMNLHAAGAEVVIHNRSRAVVDALAAEGLSPAHSPREVAERAQVVIVMASDTPAVEQIVNGNDGIASGIAPDGLVIDMGTTAVEATRELAKTIESRGAHYVDAPVSGGEIGAKDGTLTIMAGGTREAVSRAMPCFEVMGSHVTHVGDAGAGQIAKAANQVIVGLTIGAVAEALALAKRAGADPAKVRKALQGGFAASRILEVHGQRMIDGVFVPGGKAATQRKDMQQALDLAASIGLELPATALSRDLYDRLIAAGGADLDHSGLYTVIDV